MGEGWEWVAAGQGNDGCGSCQTYHVGIHPQEDRGGTTGAVGEGETEEGDVKSGTNLEQARFGGRLFALINNHSELRCQTS